MCQKNETGLSLIKGILINVTEQINQLNVHKYACKGGKHVNKGKHFF